MKMSLKLFSGIALVGITSLLFYSCQKNGKEATSKNLDAKELQAKIEKAKAWMATQPKMVFHPLHEEIRNFRIDANGNEVPFRSSRITGSGPGCDPVSSPQAVIENWAITDADCAYDGYYQVSGEFHISSENAVVSDNPNNSSQHTYGRLLIRNTSNVLVYSKEDIPVTITDLGQDPNDLAAHIYKIAWVTTSLSSSYINASYSMRLGLYYYTECEEENRYSYAPVTNWFNINATVCSVASPVFIDPSGHSLLGVSACSCCNPEIVPSAQKISFSRAGFGGFTKQLGVTDVYFPTTSELPRGYTYTVEYWNIGPSSCEGPHLVTSTFW
jgi:hypothetical protein